MNAFTADNLGQRPPEAGGQPSDAFPVDRLYTSTDIAAMQNEQLAQIVGVTPEGNNLDRSELERKAYAAQLRKLGRIICSFSNSSASEQVSEAQVEAVAQEDDATQLKHDKYLKRFEKFDVDEDKSRLTYYDASPDDDEDSQKHDRYLGGLLGIELSPMDDSEDVAFFPDDEVEEFIPYDVAEATIAIPTLYGQTIAFWTPSLTEAHFSRSSVGAIDAAIQEGGELTNFSGNRINTERIGRSINVLSDAARDALLVTKDAFLSIVDKITPSRRSLRRFVAGAAVFSAAYTFLPRIEESPQKESFGQAPTEAAADLLSTDPLETIATETTIEVSVSSPTVVATDETVVEQTTVEIEAPTTTEAPKSISEKLLSGEMSREQVAAVKYAEIDIPALCLQGIDAYGSNRRSSDDAAVLNYFVEQGLLSEKDADALARGKASEQVETQFFKLFDKIYLVEQAETPQEACETAAPMDNSKYPPRWKRPLKDLSIAGSETALVKDIEPVVDIDTQGALPGQVGNVIISGHRTTESAVFANLDQLKVGDTITIRTDDGKAYTYVVESNSPVDVDLINKDYYGYLNSYVSPTSDRTATIMTCTSGTDSRIIIRAAMREQA